MIKKISYSVFLFLVSNFSFASSFYAGISAGWNATDFSENITVQNPYVSVKETNHLSGTGPLGSLFVGYAWMHHWFYLGGEANANLSLSTYKQTNKEAVHGSNTSITLNVRNELGLSLLPGYVADNNTLIFYGRVGYIASDFHFDDTSSSQLIKNTSLNGLRLGLGIEKILQSHIGIRLEYNYLNYNTVKIESNDLGTATQTVNKVTPTTSEMEIGADYRF